MLTNRDEHPQDTESKDKLTKSAIILQQAFRRYQFIKQSKTIKSEPQPLDEKCKGDFARLMINMPPPLPKNEFPVDQAQAALWVEAHPPSLKMIAKKIIQSITHYSHKKFETRLKATLGDFMKTLMSYPVSQREYILVLPNDAPYKSSGWVAGLAMPYLQIKPAKIQTVTETVEYLKQRSDVKHFIFMDDCIYSGNQFSDTIWSFIARLNISVGLEKVKQMRIYIHVCVPFMTPNGHRKIVKNNINRLREHDIKMLVHLYQPVLTMSDFAKFGIFSEDEFKTLVENHRDADATPFKDLASVYFDHKVADRHSTLQSILCGNTIDRKNKVDFIEDFETPYYRRYKPS